MGSLVFEDIYKIYPKDVVAVRGFNLEVKDKEFIVLVGPSGCGKSTILRMVAGLEEITKGKLYIDNKLVNGVAPKDRHIAMVFQNYALYPHMTVYENMSFGLKLMKIPKGEIDMKVRAIARSLGIEDLLDRKPKALSGGQRQRVALGRAIVRNPKIFLMDEPLSNLDAKLRVQTRAKISKLHEKLQTTFLYVTHDQTEAMTMGDRIVIMNNGVVQQVASPQEIYNNPSNVFVAGFIGSPQMNFIKVLVKGNAENCNLVFGNAKVNISMEKAEILEKKGYIGKTIIMGIRPEDIYDGPALMEAAQDNIIQARVDVIEMLGSENYLYLIMENNRVIVRTGSKSKAKQGDLINLTLIPNKIYLFDEDTELSILN